MSEFGLVESSIPVSGFPIVSDSEDVNWKPLTRYPARFDLPPVTQDRMFKISQFLYYTNPLAHRIIELNASFAVGTGIEFEATDKDVEKVLSKFWYHPINAWDKKLQSRVRELSLYGEQAYPVTINPLDGSVILGYINPIDIVKIELDPFNTEITRKMHLSMQLAKSTSAPILDVINYDDNINSPSFGRLTGEVFFFAINKAADATRGTSDLLPLADAISMFDQYLFNALDRSAHMNAWLWDVELTGKSEIEITKWINEVQAKPPKPGSIRAHNENARWNAIAPNLSTQDVAESARMFKLYILGGIGHPEHFYGDGSKVNRGAACFTEDTEVLTESGWKKGIEVARNGGYRLATVDLETLRTEFALPSKTFLSHYSGPIVNFLNHGGYDLSVTPNHNILRHRWDCKRKMVLAKNTADKMCLPSSGSGWEGTEVDSITIPGAIYNPQSRVHVIPDRVFRMDDWLKFLAWYITEGFLDTKGFPISISQKKFNLDNIFLSLGIHVGKHDNGKGVTVYVIHDKSFYLYLENNTGSKSHNKKIPEFIFSLSKRQRKLFLDELVKGDGHIDNRPNRTCGNYTTVSEQMASDFQRLAFSIGLHSVIKERHKDKFSWYQVMFSEKKNKVVYKSTQNYSGNIWCFTVEPYHTLVTRRNGCIAISGNTEMTEPTFRTIQARQFFIKNMISHMFDFAIDQAILARVLLPDVNRSYNITMPELSLRDLQRTGGAMFRITQALQVAETNGWINKERATELFNLVARQLGF